MVPAPAHMLQEIISLQQLYMGKRSRFAAECCFHKFFLGVEVRGFPEFPACQQCRLVSALLVRAQPHYGLLTMMSNEEYPRERLCRFLLQR